MKTIRFRCPLLTSFTSSISAKPASDFTYTFLIPGELYHCRCRYNNWKKNNFLVEKDPENHRFIKTFLQENSNLPPQHHFNDNENFQFLIFDNIFYSLQYKTFEAVFIDARSGQKFIFVDVFCRLTNEKSRKLFSRLDDVFLFSCIANDEKNIEQFEQFNTLADQILDKNKRNIELYSTTINLTKV